MNKAQQRSRSDCPDWRKQPRVIQPSSKCEDSTKTTTATNVTADAIHEISNPVNINAKAEGSIMENNRETNIREIKGRQDEGTLDNAGNQVQNTAVTSAIEIKKTGDKEHDTHKPKDKSNIRNPSQEPKAQNPKASDHEHEQTSVEAPTTSMNAQAKPFLEVRPHPTKSPGKLKLQQ